MQYEYIRRYEDRKIVNVSMQNHRRTLCPIMLAGIAVMGVLDVAFAQGAYPTKPMASTVEEAD